MNHEIQTTTSFLEGASCSGKTRLLTAINQEDVAVILKNWPPNVSNPPLSFFLEGDEDKLLRARNATEEIKLVDRGYLSTLTFYSVLEEQEGISATPVYKWFINEMGRKLYRPDNYIFIDVPAEVTLDRAQKCNREMASNNMWFKYPERIDHWYNKLLAVFEPATSVYRIDGNRNPKIVAEEFNDLIHDMKKGVRK